MCPFLNNPVPSNSDNLALKKSFIVHAVLCRVLGFEKDLYSAFQIWIKRVKAEISQEVYDDPSVLENFKNLTVLAKLDSMGISPIALEAFSSLISCREADLWAVQKLCESHQFNLCLNLYGNYLLEIDQLKSCYSNLMSPDFIQKTAIDALVDLLNDIISSTLKEDGHANTRQKFN